MAIRIAMDLEFYAVEEGADDTKLIQLGYCIFDTQTKDILYTGGDYLKIDIPLSPYIIKLTSISQRDVDQRGISVVEAVDNMNAKCLEYKVDFNQFCVWGNGDPDALLKSYLKEKGQENHPRHQLFDTGWKFGTSYLNLKAVYQAVRIQEDKSRKGGLKKSLNSMGVEWQIFKDVVAIDENGRESIRQRSAHDARADSLNTALMYLELFK